MKREEFIQNVKWTAAIILGSAVFVSLFVMNLLIQTHENIPMRLVWTVGITAFLAVIAIMIYVTVTRYMPPNHNWNEKPKQNNNYSFLAIARRRMERLFAKAEARATPVQAKTQRISARQYDIPLY